MATGRNQTNAFYVRLHLGKCVFPYRSIIHSIASVLTVVMFTYVTVLYITNVTIFASQTRMGFMANKMFWFSLRIPPGTVI